MVSRLSCTGKVKQYRREKFYSSTYRWQTPEDFTAHLGIKTYIDAAHDIAHNKVMIIDRKRLLREVSILPKRLRSRMRRTFLLSAHKIWRGLESTIEKSIRSTLNPIPADNYVLIDLGVIVGVIRMKYFKGRCMKNST